MIILGVVLVLLSAFLYVGKRFQVIEIVKSVQIQASQQDVYEMISQLNNYPKWSPFLAQDPTQQYTVTGTDGTVGARYEWEGNKGKDVGFQEIVNLKPLEFIGIECTIQKPFRAHPVFEYRLTKQANTIAVEQKFKLESGLVDAFFLGVFGVKKEMEATNQQGLNLLKQACEK